MQETFPTIAAAALEYAARGWHVFPAPPGEKKSHKSAEYSGGREWGATTDPAEIARDWQRWPQANVGIVCGPKSGLLVIEADTEAAHGTDGIGNLAALIAQNGPLPDTIEALSPSGSWHLYFKWPDGWDIGNSAGLVAPGVDVRGDGGMVIGVPSVKPGAAMPYRWKNPPPMFGLADCPEWLLNRCLKLPEKASPAGRLKIDTGGGSGGFWRNVNDAALAGLDAWAPALFPSAKKQATGGWRVSSRDLGRDLEEDLSLHPDGIQDFGPEITMTPIDVVQQFGGAAWPKDAALWLCDKLGKDPATLGWTHGGAATADGQPRPNAPDEIDLSQDALASDLGARSWDQNARHVASWGKWLFWTGTHWQADDRLDHLTQVRTYLRGRADELTGWAERKAAALDAEKEGEGDKLRRWAKDQARNMRSKNTVAAVESLARSNRASVARADAFDADPLLLGTPGGTVDLRTGDLRQAEPSDMITKLTACAPAAPGSRPERWLTFLHEIFDGDADLVAFMQRAAGYALTGLTTEHKLLFLYGTGRNGKSAFLNVLTWLWQDYARRAAAETFLNTQGEKHSTGLAGLQGARLVAGSELPVGKTWDESVIKDLTGGDRMTARFMRGDFFDFDPQLTLMIAGNNQPSFRGVDEAIRARVVLVPFTVTIPPERRDKSLPDKLKAEGPAILRWAIEGALQWLDKGLNVPAKVAAALTEYMDDEDTLGQFLIDNTTRDPDGFVTITDLHEHFKFWAEKQGLHVWTLRTLQKDMKSRGWREHRRNYGRGFLGLKLKE